MRQHVSSGIASWRHPARSLETAHRSDFGVTQLDQAPYKAHRRVIDVSGDGDNNSGRAPAAARDVAIAKGITINGLVILTEPSSHSYSSHTNPPGGLANYYRNNVIGGAGAFVARFHEGRSAGAPAVMQPDIRLHCTFQVCNGSCVTSIAGRNGVAQLYER